MRWPSDAHQPSSVLFPMLRRIPSRSSSRRPWAPSSRWQRRSSARASLLSWSRLCGAHCQQRRRPTLPAAPPVMGAYQAPTLSRMRGSGLRCRVRCAIDNGYTTQRWMVHWTTPFPQLAPPSRAQARLVLYKSWQRYNNAAFACAEHPELFQHFLDSYRCPGA